MTMKDIPHKPPGALRLAFRVSPFCSALFLLLSIIHAIMPTAATALATANFVDTAGAILLGERVHDDIYLPLILLLLTLGVYTTIGSVNKLVSARITLNMQRRLKPAIVGKTAALDFKHIENADSWELISRVSREPDKIIMEGFNGYIQIGQIMVSMAAVLVLIVAQVWWAALVIAVFSIPMIRLALWAGRKTYKAEVDAEKFNRRTEYLGQVLSGRDPIDERTLFGYGDDVVERWQEQYEAGRKLWMKVWFRSMSIAKTSTVFLAAIAIGIALTLINPVINGLITPGMFMGILTAVYSVINQMGYQLTDSLEKVSKSGEFMKDMSDFAALSESDGALDLPDAGPVGFTDLEFRDVRFKYPTGDNYVLDGISFRIERGRNYAFVGKNGAGKTTITKLLTGLYTQYEGEILINGKELRTYPMSTLKALFSVVYQDFAKYYISMSGNIGLGDVNLMDKRDPAKPGNHITDPISVGADARINQASAANAVTNPPEATPTAGGIDPVAAANLTGLGETIAELAKGMETPLGKVLEGGQDISGGQWQRVAIARSLVSRTPVKMLDEPTAALDPISESRIYEEFEKLMEGKTTVFISHRLGSTKLADEILVIDGGIVSESGTHDELMSENGQYAEMFEAQRGWYL